MEEDRTRTVRLSSSETLSLLASQPAPYSILCVSSHTATSRITTRRRNLVSVLFICVQTTCQRPLELRRPLRLDPPVGRSPPVRNSFATPHTSSPTQFSTRNPRTSLGIASHLRSTRCCFFVQHELPPRCPQATTHSAKAAFIR